jgi:hypothetical protein
MATRFGLPPRPRISACHSTPRSLEGDGEEVTDRTWENPPSGKLPSPAGQPECVVGTRTVLQHGASTTLTGVDTSLVVASHYLAQPR